MSPRPQRYFLTGATASGKTAMAIAIAPILSAEIVSLDSMAVYREMDIGTAKPTAKELGNTPYHLVDVVSPDEEFTVADYLAAVEKQEREIHARGHNVLFVGGSPLYLKTLLRGFFSGPTADTTLRHELREKHETAAADGDTTFLHRELEKVDTTAAARLHPHDVRRIIRAIEVFQQTGKPISSLQTQFGNAQQDSRDESTPVVVLEWDRSVLAARINGRVKEMMSRGLFWEAAKLFFRKPPLSKTAAQAVGYREIFQWFQSKSQEEQDRWRQRCQNLCQDSVPPVMPCPEEYRKLTELIQLRTRQLAKRQSTWFRSLSECRFVTMPCDLQQVFDCIAKLDSGSLQRH